jgi:tetratricopeptide (TPR) repeat protein
VTLVVAYAPVFDADFLTYDDDKYVTANPVVQGGLTREGVTWAFTAIHDANWIPLVWLSLMADVELHGLEPAGFHATNVVVHAFSTGLLFAALFLLTGAPWRSLFVAGLFALHPLHVQSVAWIAERKDVLSGFFWMAALLAYALYVRRPSLARYAGILVAMGLGLLCKATLVTLPFALLLLDVWPADRLSPEARSGASPARRATWLAAEKLPLLGLSIGASLVTLGAQGQGGAIRMEYLPLAQRLANAVLAYGAYLRKTVWPADLSFYYTHTRPDPGSLAVWATGLALVAATAAALVWAFRFQAGRGRAVCVGWLWFLGTLVPMLGIVQVGGQAMADRYMYIPLVGLGIAVAWAWPWPRPGTRPERNGARPAIAISAFAGVAALLACSVLTRVEADTWRTSETLYRRAVALDPDNYTAHYELARQLNAEGRYAEAEASAREAIRLVPIWADAYLNLGAALLGQHRPGEAVRAIRRALARDGGSLEGRLMLASALIEEGSLEDARRELRRVVQQAPGHLGARVSLGSLEERLGHREAALARYDQVGRAAPGTAEAAMAAARLALLVDGWPEAPPAWVARAREVAGPLAVAQPDPFAAVARRLAARTASGARPGSDAP